MSTNMQRLGDTLVRRMKRTSDAAVPTTTELGVINGNLSLTTDSIPTPIPKGDYMVNILFSEKAYKDVDTSSLPASFRPLRGGDRVLVTWCGNEPVVTAIVVGS